jgi:hypothetical protein
VTDKLVGELRELLATLDEPRPEVIEFGGESISRWRLRIEKARVEIVTKLPALLDALTPKEDHIADNVIGVAAGVCKGCGGNGWSGGKQPLDKDGKPIGDLCDACEECCGDGKARTPAVDPYAHADGSRECRPVDGLSRAIAAQLPDIANIGAAASQDGSRERLLIKLLQFALRCSSSNPASLGSAVNDATDLLVAFRIDPRERGVFFHTDAADLQDARKRVDAVLATPPTTNASERMREAATLVFRIEAAGALEYEADNFERWKATARELAPRLRAALTPTNNEVSDEG